VPELKAATGCEVGGADVDAYRIPGSMHGVDLATRLSRDSLGTPVIVLADEGDPLLEPQALKDAPFQYYMRPVAEPFLRGLRIALDGEEAIAVEEHEAKSESDLGPVPAIDVNRLRDIVASLTRDVGAMGIILADRTGRVLIDQGATGYVDREKLAAILGPSFGRSADVSPLVGGNAWTMQYYDGERLDIYGLALGVHYFMCLIFEGSSRAFGSVTVFGRRAADQIIDLIGDAAYSVKKPEPLPLPKQEVVEEPPKPVVEEPVRKKKKKETVELAAMLDAAAEPATPVAANIDMDALFGQSIDEGLAASMFDPDSLSDLAETLASGGGERVGYDEAIDMGILDE